MMHYETSMQMEKLRAERDSALAELDRVQGELEEAKQRGNAAWQEGFDEGFASADDWLGQHEDAMAEHGWIKLPLDADRVPLCVGDMVEYVDEPDKPRTVGYIQLTEDGWWVYNSGTGRRPDKYRHRHAPTVEDVLRDYASRILIAGCIDEEDELVAQYAGKLQLKEGA